MRVTSQRVMARSGPLAPACEPPAAAQERRRQIALGHIASLTKMRAADRRSRAIPTLGDNHELFQGSPEDEALRSARRQQAHSHLHQVWQYIKHTEKRVKMRLTEGAATAGGGGGAENASLAPAHRSALAALLAECLQHRAAVVAFAGSLTVFEERIEHHLGGIIGNTALLAEQGYGGDRSYFTTTAQRFDVFRTGGKRPAHFFAAFHSRGAKETASLLLDGISAWWLADHAGPMPMVDERFTPHVAELLCQSAAPSAMWKAVRWARQRDAELSRNPAMNTVLVPLVLAVLWFVVQVSSLSTFTGLLSRIVTSVIVPLRLGAQGQLDESGASSDMSGDDVLECLVASAMEGAASGRRIGPPLTLACVGEICAPTLALASSSSDCSDSLATLPLLLEARQWLLQLPQVSSKPTEYEPCDVLSCAVEGHRSRFVAALARGTKAEAASRGQMQCESLRLDAAVALLHALFHPWLHGDAPRNAPRKSLSDGDLRAANVLLLRTLLLLCFHNPEAPRTALLLRELARLLDAVAKLRAPRLGGGPVLSECSPYFLPCQAAVAASHAALQMRGDQPRTRTTVALER